jgi:hypothetical protein
MFQALDEGAVMVTLGLSAVDWLILAVYFAFIVGLGFYLSVLPRLRKISSWPGGRTAPG